MDELATLPDEELWAIAARGEEAQSVLDDRREGRYRQQRAAEEAAKPPALLRTDDVIYGLGDLRTYEDAEGRRFLAFRQVPLHELFAACPIPEGMLRTLANANEMASRWSDYAAAVEVTR